jgi:hypothetical protein
MDFSLEYVKHMKLQTQVHAEERKRTLMHNHAQQQREMVFGTLVKLQNGGMPVDQGTVQSLFSVGVPALLESGANMGDLEYVESEPDGYSE